MVYQTFMETLWISVSYTPTCRDVHANPEPANPGPTVRVMDLDGELHPPALVENLSSSPGLQITLPCDYTALRLASISSPL